MTAILTLNKSTVLDRILHWMPRALGIAEAMFISVFALDAWQGSGSFWWKLGAFGIHLVPTIGLVVALLIAWRRPMSGGLLLVIMGTVAALLVDDAGSGGVTQVLVTLPVFVIGLLFLAEALHHQTTTGAPQKP